MNFFSFIIVMNIFSYYQLCFYNVCLIAAFYVVRLYYDRNSSLLFDIRSFPDFCLKNTNGNITVHQLEVTALIISFKKMPVIGLCGQRAQAFSGLLCVLPNCPLERELSFSFRPTSSVSKCLLTEALPTLGIGHWCIFVSNLRLY